MRKFSIGDTVTIKYGYLGGKSGVVSGIFNERYLVSVYDAGAWPFWERELYICPQWVL